MRMQRTAVSCTGLCGMPAAPQPHTPSSPRCLSRLLLAIRLAQTQLPAAVLLTPYHQHMLVQHCNAGVQLAFTWGPAL
jgi:hypothetical protein